MFGGLGAGIDVASFTADGEDRPMDPPAGQGTLYEVSCLEELLTLDGLAGIA